MSDEKEVGFSPSTPPETSSTKRQKRPLTAVSGILLLLLALAAAGVFLLSFSAFGSLTGDAVSASQSGSADSTNAVKVLGLAFGGALAAVLMVIFCIFSALIFVVTLPSGIFFIRLAFRNDEFFARKKVTYYIVFVIQLLLCAALAVSAVSSKDSYVGFIIIGSVVLFTAVLPLVDRLRFNSARRVKGNK